MVGTRTARRLVRAAGLLLLGLTTVVAVAVTVAPTTAVAAVYGDQGMSCRASVNGTSVTDQDITNAGAAVDVPEHTQVTVAMQAAQPLFRRLIRVVFVGGGGQRTTPFNAAPSDGFGWTADDETNLSGSSWTTTVAVDQYSRYGIGLYQVEVDSSGPRGGCEIDALVRFAGNPLGTVAGEAGAGAAVLGALGLAASGVAAAGESGSDSGGDGGSGDGERGDDWYPNMYDDPEGLGFCWFLTLPALLLTAAAMVTGPPPSGPPPPGDPPPPDTPPLGPRYRPVRWRPRLSVIGVVSGLLGATGVVVLLQQAGQVFPTITLVIVAWVCGLLAGLVIPSLARLVAVGRINRRRAARAGWV